jgi:predicted AAA+ superfamily ATPase
VSKPAVPLKGYADSTGAFKLFMVDVGLLSAMSRLDVRVLLEGDALFTEFKGALTEQFACQELRATSEDMDMAYWANELPNRAEVDFILQLGRRIIPLEVKSSTNLKAKSLKVYMDKYKPAVAVRSSLADYWQNGNLYDIPLYALSELKAIVEAFEDMTATPCG